MDDNKLPRARLVDRYERLLAPTPDNIRDLSYQIYLRLRDEYYGALRDVSASTLVVFSERFAEHVYTHFADRLRGMEEDDKRHGES